eukprot:scaffold46380_cov57-Phaeocystis_antarctica.AAC.6
MRPPTAPEAHSACLLRGRALAARMPKVGGGGARVPAGIFSSVQFSRMSAEPSGAEPSGAEPSGAEPSGAEPSGAEPIRQSTPLLRYPPNVSGTPHSAAFDHLGLDYIYLRPPPAGARRAGARRRTNPDPCPNPDPSPSPSPNPDPGPNPDPCPNPNPDR